MVVGAQERKPLLCPVSLKGSYIPVSAREFEDTLAKQVKKMAPKVQLSIARTQDVGVAGLSDINTVPSPDVARKLASSYGANRVSWIQIQFNPTTRSRARTAS